jgi:DNA polymerase
LGQVQPEVLVVLGATALKSVLQDGSAAMGARIDAPFQHDGRWVVTVYHPSFVLRARDEDSRQQAYEVIVAGLRQALKLAPARSG